MRRPRKLWPAVLQNLLKWMQRNCVSELCQLNIPLLYLFFVRFVADDRVETKLASQFGIKGFPTLKWFKNGKPSDYNGGRTEAEIVSWINKKSGPAVHTIRTEDDLLKFQESHNVFTLGLFGSADSDSAKKFSQLASSDELHVFAVSTEEQVRNKLGVASDTVVVIKNFDDLRSDLSVAGGFDNDEVATFVMGSSTPLIQEFTAEASKGIFSNPITKHVLFFTNKNSDHHKTVMDAYRAAAGSFKGRLLFVNVPSTESRVMEFFGLTAADVPRTVLADLNPEGGQMKKYMYAGEHSVEAFSAYADQFLAGQLVPTLKSEPVGPNDTAGSVVVLRGESFADIVLNNDKDVFVEFYAPWCGHCKKLGRDEYIII
jgi:protein disulfide-isomerase A1